MTAIYCVRIVRTDRDEPDDVYVRAYDKASASDGVQLMFGERCKQVLNVTRKGADPYRAAL